MSKTRNMDYATKPRDGLTCDWNGHYDHPIQGAHLSDFEVAVKVRMLMRDDWHHESICTLARDRIMGLSKEVARLNDLLAARIPTS